MGNRFIGAIAIAATVFAAGAGQFQLTAQQRAPQPAATLQPAQPGARPALVAGHPNLNGVWQAINSANWNLEAHSVSALSQAWQYGAILSIPAGKSVLKGGG